MVELRKERDRNDDYRTAVLSKIVRNLGGVSEAQLFDYFPQHKDEWLELSPSQAKREGPAVTPTRNAKQDESFKGLVKNLKARKRKG